MMKLLIAIASVFLLSACTVTPPKPEVEDDGSITSIANESDIEMTLIKRHGDPERYCAARQSDVADVRSAGASLGVRGVGVGDVINEGTSQGALALGGRSPSVLIVREMMYRACELSLNLNASPKETLEIYKMFIDAAKDISSIQTEGGSAAIGQNAASNVPSASVSLISESDSSSSSDDDSTDDD